MCGYTLKVVYKWIDIFDKMTEKVVYQQGWVMSLMCVAHVSHTWMSHVTHVFSNMTGKVVSQQGESYWICVWFMTPSYVCHDTFIRVPLRTHMCVVTRSYAFRELRIRVSRLTHTSLMSVMSHICMRHVMSYIDTRFKTHSYMCHDSCIYMTWHS